MDVSGIGGGGSYSGMTSAQNMAVILAARASMAEHAAKLAAAAVVAAASPAEVPAPAAEAPAPAVAALGSVDLYL